MKILQIVFILIFLLVGHQMHADIKQSENYELYVDQIIKSFAEDMQKEFGLVCIGDGGRMPNDVEEVQIRFRAYRRATIEEARALEIVVSKKLVDAINAHEKIRPYLREFPFTENRVTIALSFHSGYFDYADGSVAHVFHATNKKKLFYWTYDPFTTNTIDLLDEPYDEAVKIVQSNPPKDLRVHQEKEYERPVDQTFDAFVATMYKEYGLRCESIGGKMADGIEEIGARLIVFRKATMEEARELEVVACEKLLQAINNNEQLRPHLKKYPLTMDRLKIWISFRNSRNFSNHEGIDSVSQANDEISYVVYPPLPPWKEGACSQRAPEPYVFAKEPYKKALDTVQNTPPSKKRCKPKSKSSDTL